VFFGLGTADAGAFGGPDNQSLYLAVQPKNFAPSIVGFDGTGVDGTNPQAFSDPNCGGDGTYRLRMNWSASTKQMVISVQTNYTGGPFHADCTLPPIAGGNNGFNASNARIFIGGDWNAVFDDRLKSSNPEYGVLVGNIRNLMQDKRYFADKIMAAINDVARLSDLITRNILAIDGLSVQIGANANIIDARVNSYLKDMERRAFDRLLKYHYYMAKAYEYRMVRPYTGTLNLESLYNKMTDIATAGTNAATKGSLDDGQRKALKSVFREVIADTTESIITDYNNNPPRPPVTTINYGLNTNEIAALNRGEKLTLNFYNRGLFLADDEDIRISDLQLLTAGGMGTRPANGFGDYGNTAYVELCMEHSGISNLKLDGKIYQFRHYNEKTRNAITWKSRYDPNSGIVDGSFKKPVQPSDSLLRSLLDNSYSNDDVLLYSRPSAWANLTIWRAGVRDDINGPISFGLGTSNAPIAITNVILQLTYDRAKRGTANWRGLEVVAAQVDDSSGTRIENDALAPYFTVSSADLNGRQYAQGRFVRTYNVNNPAFVQVTAQDLYGSLGFYKWTENGADIGADPTIALSTTTDHRVVAQYVSLLPIPITISKTASQAVLSWRGGVGVRLQRRSCLLPGCAWQDVAGTTGQSSVALPLSPANESYFRLVRDR
jgi:hypothetical protein